MNTRLSDPSHQQNNQPWNTHYPTATSLSIQRRNDQLIFNLVETNSDSELILPEGKIMFMYWNSRSVKAIVPETLVQLDHLMLEHPKFLQKYPFHLVVTQKFEGNYLWVEKLSNIFPSHYLKFISLNIFWYCFLVEGRKYDENIMSTSSPLLEKYTLTYHPKQESSCELLHNLELEVSKVEGGILEMEERLKEESVMDIILLYRKILAPFQKYHQLLEDGITKMEMINTKLEEKEMEIGKLLRPSQVVNSNHSKMVGHKKVLDVINLEIQNSNLTQQKQKKELHILNSHVVKTEERIKELYQELNSLQPKSDTEETRFLENSNLLNKSEVTTPQYGTHRVAILIHLYHFTLWNEFLQFITNLAQISVYFDIYLNLGIDVSYNQSKITEILHIIKTSPLKDRIVITYSKNQGREVEGFLISYQKIISLGRSYDSMIKLHTLDNEKWRFALVYSLLGNSNIIRHNLSLLQKPQVGMIGFQIKPLEYKINKLVKYHLTSFKKNLNITELQGNFIPGNIFWIRSSILKSYLTPQFLHISIPQIQNISELPARIDSKLEAWERLFGLCVNHSGYLTVSYDYEE